MMKAMGAKHGEASREGRAKHARGLSCLSWLFDLSDPWGRPLDSSGGHGGGVALAPSRLGDFRLVCDARGSLAHADRGGAYPPVWRRPIVWDVVPDLRSAPSSLRRRANPKHGFRAGRGPAPQYPVKWQSIVGGPDLSG